MITITKKRNLRYNGFLLIEVLLGIAIASLLITGFSVLVVETIKTHRTTSLEIRGRALAKESLEVIQDIENSDFSSISSGTWHPKKNGSTWVLETGPETMNGIFTRSLVIGDVSRDASGFIVTGGGSSDTNSKGIMAQVSWNDRGTTRTINLPYTAINVLAAAPPGGGPPFVCTDKADVMLVLDRSASIDASSMAKLKNAAVHFVDLLRPASLIRANTSDDDLIHIGQVSFASSASTNRHLTYKVQGIGGIKNAINLLPASGAGTTDMRAGIFLAFSNDLANPTYDRADATAADYMILITDGVPKAPVQPGDPEYPKKVAKAAADAAKAAGVKIITVAVIDPTNPYYEPDAEAYLRNQIASPGYYYSADSYTELDATLSSLAAPCP